MASVPVPRPDHQRARHRDPNASPERALPGQVGLLGNLLDPAVPEPATLKTPPKPLPAPADGPRWWPFAYIQRGLRDPRFDLLRGFCLIAMVINGLGGNSWLYALTGGDTFYISAAEGFVFIAGYVLGLNAVRETLDVTARQLVRRSWLLYRLAIGITFVFGPLAALGRLQLWYPLPEAVATAYAGRPDAFVVGTFALTVAYHGAEFLVLFLVLFLAAPLALLACIEQKGWLVPLVSIGLYLAAQLYSDQFRLPFATYLSLPAWQLLFFGGLTIGYHRRWLGEQLARRRLYWWCYTTLVVVAALVLLILYRLRLEPALLLDRENVEAARVALTPRRLLTVALYLQFFIFLATWFWGLLRTAFGWFLLSLGRNSLWVFTLHLPLIVLFHNLPFLATADRTVGTVAQVLAIVALWGSLKLRDWARESAYRAALPTSRAFRRLTQR